MRQPTLGSLFAGIGGFDLGFERAGFKTLWQVEIDPFCAKVLERNFPDAERFSDIRDCGAHNLRPVDVICGGFPCQPHSHAGPRTGKRDDRWLWPEFERIIRLLRPRFVVVENVPGLLTTAFGDVLSGLADCGYDAEWQSISAASMGLPHQRDRLWIVAYPGGAGLSGREEGSRVFSSSPTQVPELGDSAAGAWRDLDAAIRGVPHLHGVSLAMVRAAIKPFGNAVVPQIPQFIAEKIRMQL